MSVKTTAVRIYGANDLRLETFELPPLKDDEILCRIVSDSICMSSHKAAIQGAAHKRVPKDVATHPTIIGHEFAGYIEKVGPKAKGGFKPGQKFGIQPALNYKGSQDAPGYSFRYCGGQATWCIMPMEVMEMDCLLPYDGDAFFKASLAEPMSTIIGAHHANFHQTLGVYTHDMGARQGGAMAILAGAGPMGLGHIDYALHGPRVPRLLVVTDIDQARLDRAASIHKPADAAKLGVRLEYVNTRGMADPVAYLRGLTPAGKGFDDVFVLAPVASVVEQADAIMAFDGCMNFFAGPTDSKFSAKLNFYEIHYGMRHLVGTSGGNTEDMREALRLMSAGKLNPAAMITHVGGINAAIDTTMRLPEIPGGKKLIYTHKNMPLVALDDFAELG
ncbi:MAG TPA: zinc-binding dehydrogenase, partial [Candidatus Brocadiia bacterium]|nr:zinc-binding dehydrogenase [Candidatus Brocadiia bacterium]